MKIYLAGNIGTLKRKYMLSLPHKLSSFYYIVNNLFVEGEAFTIIKKRKDENI